MAGTTLRTGDCSTRVRLAGALLLAATILGGVVATTLVRRDTVGDRDARERAAAEVGATTLSQVALQVVSELRGANGLVDSSGTVPSSAFRSFAADVVGGAVFDSIAHEIMVERDDRRDFEERYRLPIVERAPTGGFVTAPDKARYLPVIDVWPISDLTRPLPGFDISSDPIRERAVMAATAGAGPAISAPVRLAPSNAPGYFVVQPLFRNASLRTTSDDIVGYVSAAFPVATLIDRVLAVLPTGARLAVFDSDATIASDPAPPPREPSVTSEFGGRRVQLSVHLPGAASWTPAILTALASLAVLVGLAATLVLTRRIEEDGRRATLLSDLAQKLAASRSTDETRAVIRANCSPLLRATTVDVKPVGAEREGTHDVGVVRSVPLRSVEGDTLALMEIAWPSRVSANRTPESLVTTVAGVVAQSLDRARQAEEETSRASSLAALARQLSAGSTTDDLTTTLLQQATVVVGCALVQFGLIDDDWLTIRAVGRTDPAVVTRRVSLSHRTPMTTAIHTNEPVLMPDTATFEAEYPDLVAIATEPWLAARAALPLRRSDGAVFGAIGFGWARPVDYTGPLLSTITTVVDLAAQALERSEFTGRQTRAALSLADFAQHLAAASDQRDVVIAVEQRLRGILQARAVTLTRAIAPSDADQPGDGDAVAAILRRGQTTIVSDDDGLEQLRSLHEHAGAIGIVPIRDADGGVTAAITIAWRRTVPASDALMAMLDTVGTMVGQTIGRTQLYELEHGLFRDLQTELLRPLPHVEGLDAAARYEPASRSIDIGGDWYSAVRLSDERVAFVIGDVLGHGVEAVAAMGRFQSVVLGLVTSLSRLDEVFVRASELTRDDGATLATALLVVIDVRRRTLSYLSAGHPPALLRIGTEIDTLEGARQSLLGLPLDPQTMEERPFPVGSVLVMYTDGLVERRTEDLDDGIARLAGLLHDSDESTDAGVLAAQLIDGCREDANVRADDTAVIVVRSI